VTYYNHQRLHAALKYLRPIDYLNGQESEKLTARRKKLTTALKMRRQENRKLHNQIVKEQKAVA
jgi:hypothetical protein